MPAGVLVRIGSTKVETLARGAGVNPHTLRHHLMLRGISPMHEACMVAGMSVADVASALGITKSGIYRYIERGYIRAQYGYALTTARASIDPYEVSAFLARIGGLLPLNPDRMWADEYHAAREALHGLYSSSVAVAQALMIPPQQLAWMRKHKAMPAPAFAFGALGTYYSRAALLAWLDTVPAYDRPGTRAALQERRAA